MTPSPDATAAVRPNLAWGWTLLAIFMLGGLTLEGFHGVKLAPYLDHALRRELWTLGHAHGALLAVVNLVYAATAPALLPVASLRRAGTALRWGALLMPLGFFLGGVGNSESDPSLAILLTPAGALLVIYAAVTCALAAWRRGEPAEEPIVEGRGPAPARPTLTVSGPTGPAADAPGRKQKSSRR